MQDDLKISDKELEEVPESMRKRIVALELLLEASRHDARERERLLSERELTIGILRRELAERKKHFDTKGYPKI